MLTAENDSDIRHQFKKLGLVDPEQMEQGKLIMTANGLSLVSFISYYETFTINERIEKVSTGTMKSFGNYVKREIQKEQKPKHKQFRQISKKPRYVDLDKNSAISDYPQNSPNLYGTPDRKGKSVSHFSSPSVASPASHIKFAERKNGGKVETTLNGDVRLTFENNKRATLPTIGAYKNCQMEPYLYMFEKMQDRFEAQREKLVRFGGILEKKNNFQQTENVLNLSQESVWVVGRIICDSEGRLNDKSILLQTVSVDRGTKDVEKIIELDVSSLKEYSFFPGQIVAIKGLNTSGHVFIAQEVISNVTKPMLSNTKLSLTPFADQAPLDLVVAAGPFTANDELSFEPLDALFEIIIEKPTDVLILIGPFLDITHPTVDNCWVEDSFEEIFEKYIMTRIEKLLQSVTTMQIILVPSLRDVHHDRMFPQPPYQSKFKHERLKYFSNPCTLTINEFSVGISSADILFQLSREEISKTDNTIPSQKPRPNRLARLTSHLLEQRSYYPLYPPSPEVNIDSKHSPQQEMACTPDILILPSDMKFFANNVNNCLAVNPGRLTKSFAGGTYGRIKVNSANSEHLVNESDKTKLRNNVFNRSKVQIIRV